jgi:hypothetical protein
MHRPTPTGQGAALLVESLEGRAEVPKAHDEAFRPTAINCNRPVWVVPIGPTSSLRASATIITRLLRPSLVLARS